MTRAEQRIIEHQAIRLQVIALQFEEAILQFKQTLKMHGPHVGLLCDFAGCYYEMGQFQDCWEIVEKIKEEFSNAEKQLSANSKYRTLLILGKFYEEMAEPQMAIDSYKDAINYTFTLENEKWIYANEIRILSYFGKTSDLHKKYLALTSMNNTADNLKIEILHGLMWAEWALFGHEHARQRWVHSQKQQSNEIDNRLLARDFTELSILSNAHREKDFLLATSLLATKSPLDYDKALLSLLAPEQDINIDEYNLSPMMKIRLVLLKLFLSKNINERNEHFKKYSFLIKNQSKSAQVLFRMLIASSEVKESLLIINKSDKTIDFADRSALKITNLQVKFLSSFVSKSDFTLEELSHELWQTNDIEHTYHRLRMLIYKLNDQLTHLLGFVPFEIKKEGVTAHSKLQVQLK